MESVFQSADCEFNNKSSFWTVFDSSKDVRLFQSRAVLLEDELTIKANQELRRKRILLTSDMMFCCDLNPELNITNTKISKYAYIQFKKVEPFVETNGSEDRYGFRLISSNSPHDFYTSSADKLEEWLDYLSNICIMSDLENDYELLNEIGKGTYSYVHKAYCYDTGEYVAVKAIPRKEILANLKNLHALINEITILRKISHPNIMRLRRVYETEDFIYIITDYIQGGELFQRIITRGKISESDSIKLMKNLLEALAYIHSKGIAHRDLKPENILMVSKDSDSDFKIIDFGLAIELEKQDHLRCGSPGYVAPEILRSMDYDEKVDIFSAGIILYIMLSGRSPFPGKTCNEILRKNKECRIYFQEKYWGEISREAIDMVLKLTEVIPADRPSAKEALEDCWMYNTDIQNEQTTRESALNLIKSPYISPYKAGISRELMSRVYNKNNSTQLAYNNCPNINSHNIRTINSIDCSCANSLLASLRTADPVIKPKAEALPVILTVKDCSSASTSVSKN